MTEKEAIEYIENYTWSSTRLGLFRTRELLELLGNPQKELKFIHVAGSNGKGSTCAMLDSVLRKAGYVTGLYTSPHIERFTERMKVNGEEISGAVLARITEKVKEKAESMTDHPSQFELATAIGMCFFAECGCDIVVLEVGMGGELDSTNVIDVPEVAVITNIGLDHTEYLGDTLEKIARAKGGIIKSGGSVVCYESDTEVLTALADICSDRNAELTVSRENDVSRLGQNLEGQTFIWKGIEYFIPLLGEHQIRNAALVLETVSSLNYKGWNIDQNAIEGGLRETEWPARMEVLNSKPLFLLDGGHNPQCARALAESLDVLLPGLKSVFLMGVLADKDYETIIKTVAPYASGFVCVTPDSSRALQADALKEMISSIGIEAVSCSCIEDGILAAIEKAGLGGRVIAFGSLYMSGTIRSLYPKCFKKFLRQEKLSAREELCSDERDSFSEDACRRITGSDAYKNAENIMLYKQIGSEMSLDYLIEACRSDGKKVAYPYCVDTEKMKALIPESEEAFSAGRFGIQEPLPFKSEEMLQETIDLIVCPCTAFDPQCTRLGMGAGYYDRFIINCRQATVICTAFEVQKTDRIPKEKWDVNVQAVYTEKTTYFA